ncbi:hypothetical protein FB451DRAFT_110466 [Mycena latifolia]|nr:hypothetical protein FB451DRAFT_110466 [Mycena latifolia]
MARHDFTARPRLVRLTHSASQTYQGLVRRIARVLWTQRLGVARNVQNLLRAGSEGRRSLGRRLTRGVGSTPSPRTAGRARARVEITNLSNPAGGMKPSLLAVKDIDIAIGADTYNCIILSTMTWTISYNGHKRTANKMSESLGIFIVAFKFCRQRKWAMRGTQI